MVAKVTHRDPTDVLKILERYPPKIRDYWYAEFCRVRFTEIVLDWNRRGIPAMRDIGQKFENDTAFVFGTGPSLKELSTKQIAGLQKFLTIGVNRVPHVLQEDYACFQLPAITLLADYLDDFSRKDQWDCFLKPYNEAQTLLIMSEDVVGVEGGLTAPFPVWLPDWGLDLSRGLPLVSIVAECKFARCVIAATYLAACLKERVVMIGVDHGSEYNAGDETKVANLAFEHLKDFLREHGRVLLNAGTKSRIETVPRADLDDELEL